MRRLAALLAVAVLAAAGAAVAVARNGRAAPTGPYRVDVIFDNARGLVAGQLVKVAGARVGQIVAVSLTTHFKARIAMDVDPRFAPFHADASCTIRPEGLIAENYVQCDPGTQDAPVLRARGGQPPTVQVGHTTEPVSLTDLFNIFDAPTRERFALIIDELGIGTAGRGEAINAVIRRANPTLGSVRRVLRIVHAQRAQVGTMIDASDRLLAGLTPHRRRLQQFLDGSAHVTATVASHRGALSRAVARLPGMLTETRGALHDVDTVASAGTPLLRSLHTAAPDLAKVSRDVPGLAAAAPAATAGMSSALKQGTKASKRLGPPIGTLGDYAVKSLPASQLSGRLYANLRDRGFPESLLSIFYYIAAASSRFDATSHVFATHLLGEPQCLLLAQTPVPGCDAHAPGAGGITGGRPPSAGDVSAALAPVLDYLLGGGR